jgi:alkanesulfonate monooxygenase SsuD/methylene tetrahydromethanopterin reductase-like flavin-dependent oxidoreductase (luciferase family)
MTRIGRERGWGPMSPAQLEALRGPRGALVVGEPAAVVEKILWERELFGLERFTLQLDVGGVSYADLMRAIELLGTEVAPEVRRAAAPLAPGPSRSR